MSVRDDQAIDDDDDDTADDDTADDNSDVSVKFPICWPLSSCHN